LASPNGGQQIENELDGKAKFLQGGLAAQDVRIGNDVIAPVHRKAPFVVSLIIPARTAITNGFATRHSSGGPPSLQALAALLPGGGVEHANRGQFTHFETGNHLGPEHDPLRIAARPRLRPAACLIYNEHEECSIP